MPSSTRKRQIFVAYSCENVKKRVPLGEWIGNILHEGQSYNLCGKCYEERTTESSGESEDADVADIAEPASKRDIRVLLQSARLMIRPLKSLPIDQRISKLEELLANKREFAQEWSQPTKLFEACYRKHLTLREHQIQTPPFKANEPLRQQAKPMKPLQCC